MNAPPPDDLASSSQVIRPGQDLSNTDAEVASVKQHINEHAKDAPDCDALTKTIFGGK